MSRVAALAGRGVRGLAAEAVPHPRDRALVAAVREVAAAVRVGAPVEVAWASVGVAAVHGVPRAADLTALDPAAAAAIPTIRAAARLTARSGAAPAAVLEVVADALDAEAEVEADRRAALAGPSASARLLGALPVIGPLLGLALGADPVAVLVDGSTGSVLLVAGTAAAVTGRWWSARLLRTARRAGADGGEGARRWRRRRVQRLAAPDPGEVGVAALLELMATACEAGASVPEALRSVGAASGGERGAALVRCSTLLALGAPWAEAWAAAPAALAPLVAGLRPAWRDGTPPVALLRAAAGRLRRERRALAAEAAGRLGVRLLLPLGLCHLPAFLLIGLVPVLVSLAQQTVGAW